MEKIWRLIKKMKTKKGKSSKLWLVLLAPLFALVLAACGPVSGQEGQTTLETAREQGHVTIGFANEQPYAFMNSDLELTGISVDIASTILENLGIPEVNGVLTEFGMLIPGLQAQRYDMATAGMFLTPNRANAEGIQFANPEFAIGEGMAVQAGNPEDLHSYEDVANNENATISTPSGTIEVDYLQQSGVPQERIVTVPDIASFLSAVQAGRADAMTATAPAIRSTIEQADAPDIEIVEDFEQPVIDGEPVEDYGATVFRETDQDFIDAWNEELRALEESGELLEIYEEYGFTEENLPEGITPEEALE